jgi:hypothetical protein
MIQDCLDEADPNKIESRNQLISFHAWPLLRVPDVTWI